MDADSDSVGGRESPLSPEAVPLKVFLSPADAEIAAALLRANGLPAWLNADDCGGMYPHLDTAQGVRLLVLPADVETARALLKAEPVPAAEPAFAASDPPAPAPSVPRVKLAYGQIFLGMVVGVLLYLLYDFTKQQGRHTYLADRDGDGVPEETLVFLNGRCIEQSLDRNTDRALDSWGYFDNTGQLTEIKEDENFDGRLDAVFTYTNGLLAESKFDTDFNGTTDVIYSYRYGLQKQADWRPNGIPNVVLRQFFRHGLLVEEWRDTNKDGAFDATNYFDAFENQIGSNTFKLLSPPRP